MPGSGRPRVVIIGGGITGLAAAHRLSQLRPDAEIVLIEGTGRLGGKIMTERTHGFVIEGGPDSFLSSKPRGLGLCRELGMEDRLEAPDPERRRSYVMHGGRLHGMPEGLTGLIPSRFGPLLRSDLLSPFGKARAGLDYVLPPSRADADETLAHFVTRRLGREIYDRLVEPLMAGIYAGDGEQLSLAATFPQFRKAEMEHGSVIRGIRRSRRETIASARVSRPLPAFLTPLTGMAEIVERVEARLPEVRVVREQIVTAVSETAGGYAVQLGPGERLEAEAVIVTTPAFAAADLIASVDPDLANLLSGIPYVSTTTVTVAYPSTAISSPLDGYGYIVPRKEGRDVLACTWVSSKFPHRAPPGYSLIRVFVGRAGREEMVDAPDGDLLALARAELEDVLGITTPPTLHRIYRWRRGMPQYVAGHLERLTAIEERLEGHPGLSLAGSAYRGVGIPDCIQSGESAAMKAHASLSTASAVS